ncbi:DNA-binding protein [Paraburkholderia azotifigens]|uniref:DNA-binding protein n=1 Tax=Paraburkholderia azotifigens TaxID=2057004 RepID=A0A5C6VEX6_9BURK|nr:DNA-binding protein [Paraburkholderia azotifigens]TXC83251.1 DNA-binding protein [Paraburkholderia azotifigens]
MNLDEERQAIRKELDALRASGARRQELSLHACKRLFFDLGIRPSMAAVRDLTQTGSASDIPKDIDSFWERIRSASRVRVGVGTIPKALEERAGELLGALFEDALTQARESLEEERQEIQALRAAAARDSQEGQIRKEISEEAIQRSEARADAAWERVRILETQLASANTSESASQQGLKTNARRLEAENESLRKRLDAEQSTNAGLRDRLDALHGEMRANAEHYAQQIKDAVAEAERRVKPMLVELDSLRAMAATYQSGVRDASRKEFDFIQQLAAAKARGDRLDAQLREQSDELDLLTRQMTALRAQQGIDPAVAQLLCQLANAGRLSEEELESVGTAVDGHVSLPAQCPKCIEGEPELSQMDHHYELLCPECEHTSGTGNSRLAAVTRFMSTAQSSTSS